MNYICEFNTEEERRSVKKRLISMTSCDTWSSGANFLSKNLSYYNKYTIYTQSETGWMIMEANSYIDAARKIAIYCDNSETYPKVIKPLKLNQEYII